MKRIIIESFSPAQTHVYAAGLARKILNTKPPRGPSVVALIGSLGAGKTEFVKGFLHTCDIRARAASPSFVIMKRYRLTRKRYRDVYHFDLYRLHTRAMRKALAVCGWADAMMDNSIVLIEWANRAIGMIPKGSLWVNISHKKREHERRITISRR